MAGVALLAIPVVAVFEGLQPLSLRRGPGDDGHPELFLAAFSSSGLGLLALRGPHVRGDETAAEVHRPRVVGVERPEA